MLQTQIGPGGTETDMTNAIENSSEMKVVTKLKLIKPVILLVCFLGASVKLIDVALRDGTQEWKAQHQLDTTTICFGLLGVAMVVFCVICTFLPAVRYLPGRKSGDRQ